jgi:hypothetical protein
MKLVELLFMSGMKFRNRHSRVLYERLKGRRFYEEDLLIDIPFVRTLELAMELL